MTPVRSVLLAAVLALAFPAGAAALPAYDGSQTFPTIHGVADPEEYSWEVQLNPEQELEGVDDQLAVVKSKTGAVAWSIDAAPAHDAEGATVPTSLAVTQPNVITLTVHHRAGNQAAGGAPFDYPVIAGDGWEGGIQTHQVQGPPEEGEAPVPVCIVPDISARTLRASRRILHRAHCKLGRVRGERSRAAHVVQQYRRAGKSLPAWTAVDVKVS